MKHAGIALLAIVILSSPAFAAGWWIESFNTNIEILPNSDMLVTEQIAADFSRESHHGIYRDISIAREDRLGSKFRYRVKLLNVTDENGNEYPYSVTYPSGYVHVRVGDPNRTISGRATYLIKYQVSRGLRFFDDHDELYWNATGNEWGVPIKSATVDVAFPFPVKEDDLTIASYSGRFGAKGEAAQYNVSQKGIRFALDQALNAQEGLTVAVGWHKGLVKPPSAFQEVRWLLGDNIGLLIPPIVFLGLFFNWYTRGRDEPGRGSIMVRYEPPQGLSPAETGTLIDERVDTRDIAAIVVDLAVRGYIKIDEISPGGFLSAAEYQFTKLKNAEINDLKDFELTVFQGIFAEGDSISTENLRNKFYKYLPGIKSALYEELAKKGYFWSRPDSLRNGYVAAGILGAFACFMIGMWTSLAPLTIFGLVLSALLFIPFGMVMPRKTNKGRIAYEEIKGLEEFIGRAELPAIELAEKRNLFEKLLPYAIVLRLSNEWARRFEGLYTEPPRWFTGSNVGVFSATGFTSSVQRSVSTVGAVMTASPRSSGSSGGGGGGGGFSGGGGGGGGGGAW